MSEKDGGPAFPNVADVFHGSTWGMSLLDYYAGQAMQGLRASEGFTPDCDEVARYSYMQARAMLAERERAK